MDFYVGQVFHTIDSLLPRDFPRNDRLVLFRARAFALFVVYGAVQSLLIVLLIGTDVGFHPMMSTSLLLYLIDLVFIILMKWIIPMDRLALAFVMLETFAICAAQILFGGSVVSPSFIFLPLLLPFAFLVCGRRLGWVAAIWASICSSLTLFALYPEGLKPPFHLSFEHYLTRLESSVFFASFHTALILGAVVYFQFRSEQSLIEEKKRTDKVKKLNELSEFAHSILSLIETPVRTLGASFAELKTLRDHGISTQDLKKTVETMHQQILTVAKVAHSYSIFLHPFERQERSVLDVNKILEYVELICTPQDASHPSLLAVKVPKGNGPVFGTMNKLVLVLVGLVQELLQEGPGPIRLSVIQQEPHLRFQLAQSSADDSRPAITKNYIEDLAGDNQATLTSWTAKDERGFHLDVPLAGRTTACL